MTRPISSSISELKSLKSLYVNCREFENSRRSIFPQSLENMKNLESIIIEQHNPKIFPDNILQLKNLKKLHYNIDGRSSNIPKELFDLVQLKELRLNYKDTKMLDDLHKLVNLEVLHLHCFDKNITTLPTCVSKLTKLKELSVHNIYLSEVSDDLTNLSNLEKLEIRSGSLSNTPDVIGKLTSLIHLDLDLWGECCSLPDHLQNLTNLRVLRLSNMKFKEIPEWFGKFINLETLQIIDIRLDSFPEIVCDLTNLKHLNFRRCNLTTLSNIHKLTKLESLNLFGNSIKALPEHIGDLCELKFISMHFNQLTKLPGSIVNLKKIEVLDLYYNCVTSVPPEICMLTSLKELHLNPRESGLSSRLTISSEFAQNMLNLVNLTSLNYRRRDPDMSLETYIHNVFNVVP